MSERVPTKQAAIELGISRDRLCWMMETGMIDIGIVMPSRSGNTKRHIIFRAKLNKVLGKDET